MNLISNTAVHVKRNRKPRPQPLWRASATRATASRAIALRAAVEGGRLVKRAALGLACIGLVACADLTAPDARQIYDAAMAAPLPAKWSAQADAAAFRPEWLGIEAHGELRALIDEAFEHNPDMRIAATRVEQARLQTELAGAKLWPTANVGGKWSNSLISADALSVSGVFASASWEVDVWGVARAGIQASEARYRSMEADYVYARASLGAAVAKAWLINTEAARELALRQAIDVDTQQQRAIVATRVQVGKAHAADLSQADAQAHATHAQWLSAIQGKEAAQRALELLLGRYPAARIEVTLGDAVFEAGALPPVPAGVPLQVLDRRPDLVSSRNAFVAAFFGSQQAKAARLPNVALTAGAGYLDTRAVGLQSQLNNLIFPVGAKIIWPLFDAGRRETEYAVATVAQSEAAARYARAIQNALGEVENALAAEREFDQRADVLALREQALANAARLADVQREVGQAERFDVLARRIDASNARIALDQMRMARLVSRVDLHLALGGRFLSEDGV